MRRQKVRRQKRGGVYEWQCPNCGCINFAVLPFSKKGQKVLPRCEECKFQIELIVN